MGMKVELYIYDLSGGLAKNLAPMLAPGLNIDGVWHTSIVIFNQEWFFGSGGIQTSEPGGTQLGSPLQIIDMGKSEIQLSHFQDYLRGLGENAYRGEKYNLLLHNCNTFSNQVANFLVNKSIPQYILDLPNIVMNSPIASMLAPIMQQANPTGNNAFNSSLPSASGDAHNIQVNAAGTGEKLFTTSHIPQKEIVFFNESIDCEKIIPKLKELNRENQNTFNESNFNQICSLVEGKDNCAFDFENELWPLFKTAINDWKIKDIFPILDILRYSFLTIYAKSWNKNLVNEILKVILSKIQNDDSNMTILILLMKILANFFKSSSTALDIIIQDREDVIEKMNTLFETLEEKEIDKMFQITAATVLLNYSCHYKYNPSMEANFQIVSAISSIYLEKMNDSDAVYRTVVAFGTLLHGNSEAKDLSKALDSQIILSRHKNRDIGDDTEEAIEQCIRIVES